MKKLIILPLLLRNCLKIIENPKSSKGSINGSVSYKYNCLTHNSTNLR